MTTSVGPSRWPANVCISTQKITDYLLNENHPEGGPKAVFFQRHGFLRPQPDLLSDVLRNHFDRAHFIAAKQKPHGEALLFEGRIPTPLGSTPRIRSIWMIYDQDPHTAWLITAYAI